MENLEVYLEKFVNQNLFHEIKNYHPIMISQKSFGIASKIFSKKSFTIKVSTHHFLSLINVPFKKSKYMKITFRSGNTAIGYFDLPIQL